MPLWTPPSNRRQLRSNIRFPRGCGVRGGSRLRAVRAAVPSSPLSEHFWGRHDAPSKTLRTKFAAADRDAEGTFGHQAAQENGRGLTQCDWVVGVKAMRPVGADR